VANQRVGKSRLSYAERILARSGQVRSAAKPILEINPRHDLILALASENDPALREDAAHLLFDEARILDGELPADARAFSQRLARMMRRGLR
jgi:molecular chaperone HtpG